MSDQSAKETSFDVAVVMPVLNESAFIGRTLEQIYLLEYPMERVEVVVADGGSTDNTRAIAESFKGRFGSLRVLDNVSRYPSAGRNVGIRHSTALCVIVLDGHICLPAKQLFRDMIDIFERTGADCLCRPQPLNPPDIDEFQAAVAACRKSLLGHRPGSEIYSDAEGFVDPTSSGAMYRRTVFDEVGRFDESFDACEDVDFNYRVRRAGLKAYLSPKLKVLYYPRESLAKLWRQMFRYGKGRFRFAYKHRAWSLTEWLAGAGAAAFVFFFCLALVSPTAREIFVTATGLYILALIFFSAYLAARERHMGCLLLGPLIFPTIHFGLGFGFLSGLLEKVISKSHR